MAGQATPPERAGGLTVGGAVGSVGTAGRPGRPPRAVLLDAFGTLVAMEPPAPRLREELVRRTGIDVGPAAAEAAFRAEIAFYVEHHLEGRDERSLAHLRDRCAEVVMASLGLAGLDRATVRAAMLAALRFRAQPDAAAALDAFRARGTQLVVASNWDCSLPRVLAEAGLAPLVNAVVSSASVGAAKPDRALFAAALDRAGVVAEEAVHVGDSPEHDVAGAQAAGIRAVLLDRPGEARAVGVPVIRTLDRLPALVFGTE
jgi:putative hydrolase of the HAD superfamily